MTPYRADILRTACLPDLTPDAVLLRDAAAGKAEAQRSLVERHGPMVLRVCRHILSDRAAADDAFQAVFLVLIRRGWKLQRPAGLAAWLFGVARRTALKARSVSMSRRGRERRPIGRAGSEPLDELTARELLVALDEEIDRLPHEYRLPLLLCYWQGLTQEQAALQLGWTAGSVKGRLERGRKQLSARLTKRGLAPSVLLTASATSAFVSKDLSAATLALASGLAAPAGVLALMGSGSMAKTISAITAAVVLVGAGVLGMAAGSAAPEPVKNEQPPAPQVQPAEVARSIRVAVLDPLGKPLSGATIHTGIWTDEKDFDRKRDYQTDATGVAEVALPKTFTILRLWAWKKPFAGMFANWEQGEIAAGKGPPAEYTFRLAPAVAAGGRVVDEQGKPVAGAKVTVSLAGDAKPKGDGRMKFDSSLAYGSDAAITDADGRWRIDNVPDDPKVELRFMVNHPNFVSDDYWQEIQKASGVTTAKLLDQSATVALKRGVIVRGRVTDDGGKPIPNAIVIHGDDPYGASSGGGTVSDVVTDADGRYQLPSMTAQHRTLTVVAPGWSPQLRRVNVRADLPPQDFQLERGKPIRLRVVDDDGRPIPDAGISIQGWQNSKSLHNHRHPAVRNTSIPQATNPDGIWEWSWAPTSAVKLSVFRKGNTLQTLEIAGGTAERTIVLKSAQGITGSVTDALTGQPIPEFAVFYVDVFRPDSMHAERDKAVRGKKGRLEYSPIRNDIPLRLRIEADGYCTETGPEFRVGDPASLVQNFRLKPSPPVTGRVLDPNGKPASNVRVTMATPTESAMLRFGERGHDVDTDADGRFSFPDPGESFALVAQSEAGFARVDFPADRHDAGELKLQPWATVRGEFHDGRKPASGAMIMLMPNAAFFSDRIGVEITQDKTTGPDGRFEFARVPPIPMTVRPNIGPWKDEGFRSGPSVPLDPKPGQKIDLNLGGEGAIISGKVKLAGPVLPDLDCNYSINFLIRREPGIRLPPQNADRGFDVRKGWQPKWNRMPEGQVYLSTLKYWFVKLAPDGGFRISGVPAGEYDLSIEVFAKPTGCLIDPLARRIVPLTVTPANVQRGAVTLPEIPVEVKPLANVGDIPALKFVLADGSASTLAAQRGQHTLVHFWASWCQPCKQQLPALRNVAERFAGQGLKTVSLSLDDDPDAWQAALKQSAMPWTHGRLDEANWPGVSSVPVYWLLDATGKIVAKANDPDEAVKLLAAGR